MKDFSLSHFALFIAGSLVTIDDYVNPVLNGSICEISFEKEYSFRTSYTDMSSTWSMNFSANFPEHGIKVLPVFEVYTPHVNLAVDDKFTLYWTILRELN